MLEPKAEKPAETAGGSSVADHDPVLHAPPTLARGKQEQNPGPQDPIIEIAARIEGGKPSSEDLKHLLKLSRSGDGRAIELLAWCDYFGIGVPRDPVAAYILYGIASLAGIAGADANQAVIYDYALTPNQRQLVLDIQNDDIEEPTELSGCPKSFASGRAALDEAPKRNYLVGKTNINREFISGRMIWL